MPGNAGMGVIAILIAMPEFDINVLYQSDAKIAIAELKKHIHSPSLSLQVGEDVNAHILGVSND